MLIKHLLVVALSLFCLQGKLANAQAQGKFATEEHFHDLFVTAGYSTAFGAALGAAFLGLTDNPTENLRFVAIGASAGFIGGSLLGTYVLFYPVVTFSANAAPGQPTLLSAISTSQEASRHGGSQLTLSPRWNTATHRVDSWYADWVIGRF